MKRTTTLIVGAGQNGLSMSRQLTQRGIDHLVIERGQIGNAWKTERWDSLKMLTPNWNNGLAGLRCLGDPEGFMPARDMGGMLDRFAAMNAAPVMEETEVLSLSAGPEGYRAQTTSGVISARSVVIANGACGRPHMPFADTVPGHVVQTSPMSYKRPSDLPQGRILVVGASASGLNIAHELTLAGREVTMAVGAHLRLPRRYRGSDIVLWMELLGAFDTPWTDVDDLVRVRRLPSLPLIGGVEIGLNRLQDMGVEIVGRLGAVNDGVALFSGGLAHQCASADLKMNRLLRQIDAWAARSGFEGDIEPVTRLDPTRVPDQPRLKLGLSGVAGIVWATGYRPVHDWIDLPVFDRKGQIVHDGGVVGRGLYVMGLPYLRTGRSSHIDGAADDAAALAAHLSTALDTKQAA